MDSTLSEPPDIHRKNYDGEDYVLAPPPTTSTSTMFRQQPVNHFLAAFAPSLATGQNLVLNLVVGQFGTRQFGTRTIWHQDNLAPDNLAPRQFGTNIIKTDNLAPDNLAPGQFGTNIVKRTIWHQEKKNIYI